MDLVRAHLIPILTPFKISLWNESQKVIHHLSELDPTEIPTHVVCHFTEFCFVSTVFPLYLTGVSPFLKQTMDIDRSGVGRHRGNMNLNEICALLSAVVWCIKFYVNQKPKVPSAWWHTGSIKRRRHAFCTRCKSCRLLSPLLFILDTNPNSIISFSLTNIQPTSLTDLGFGSTKRSSTGCHPTARKGFL